MTASIPELAALLVQAAGQVAQQVPQPVPPVAPLPDTVVTIQVPSAEGWFATLTGIADGLMTLAILVLTVVLVPAAWNFRNSYKKINELLDKVYGDVAPIMRHAHSVSDNLDYVTTSIRVDVQQVQQSVAAANHRLLRAVDLAERRVRELNALVAVVQREAEDVFVSTASTVRGVRAGMASLREDLETDVGGADMPFDPADDLEDDVSALHEPEAMWHDLAPEGGEPSDGDYDPSTVDEPAERPRVRRRPGPRA